MGVDRCICLDVPFTELKRLRDEHGCDERELSRRTGCGTGCGLCLPYVRVVLETGETDLPVIPVEHRSR